MSAEPPVLSFASKAEFEAWLEEHHANPAGIWVKFAKKGSGIPTVTNAEALDVALCFGWIDGQRKALDETHYLQRYTPRRARSKWSKINVAKVAALTERGEMRPSGVAEVERAKADGRWDAAYDSPSRIQVPPDLQAELDNDPAAKASFESLNATNRYAILYRLHDAKRPETRARRLADFVAKLKRGEKLYP
jgi:uncharacterized protein YdeI (YjbR/CyaY-like superfamily)